MWAGIVVMDMWGDLHGQNSVMGQWEGVLNYNAQDHLYHKIMSHT